MIKPARFFQLRFPTNKPVVHIDMAGKKVPLKLFGSIVKPLSD